MHQAGTPARSPRIFYGWILVVVLLLLVSIGMGTTMYMYSLVAGAVGEEFSAGRLTLMAGSTGMLLVMGLLSPTLGRLLDRVSSRWILVVGSIVMGLGFLWVAFSSNVWMVVASYILLISVGAATLSLLATATLLTRWFVRYRGLAIGIAALGTQFGGFFYPPLFAATMEAHDWRVAVGAMGVLIMVMGPLLTWLFVVDRPALKGLTPLGGEAAAPTPPAEETSPVAPATVGFARLLGQRNFWLIVLIAGAGMATNTTLLANLSLFAVDMGEPVVRGAFLVSLVALLGVFASPFLGWLSDTINIKLVVAIMTLSLAAACLLFNLARSYDMLLLAAVFMGIGGGGVFPIYASLVGHLYDTRVYGEVLGSTTLLNSIIAASAPLFAGWVFDVTGSYQALFLTLMIALVVFTVAILLLQVPKDPAEKFGALAVA
ncbi:MFS transporter [Mangrovimicrobium sediminis]|uniref:MFS transporter n=1 Tax=Mangrovimicrobium sediminis TaxID=2562682 RepID=A0A4Z0LZC7_9GAMM|nr:MFS transporter [Haliea sp. SAOS-164]TGD72517.1 MFS transporter [Haliea sp. SAOS-164]